MKPPKLRLLPDSCAIHVSSGWKLASLVLFMAVCQAARAEPWIEVGDRSLRSDVDLLEGWGLIDGPMTTWPLPAGQFATLSDSRKLLEEPVYVQLAARRVLARLLGEGQPQGLTKEARISTTNHPDSIRDFGDLARQNVNGEVGLIWDAEHVSAGLRVSSEPRLNDHDTRVGLDGSYADILLGNWQVYGGWIDKWYGPGWTSSLTLSNNARPVPKVGITRNNPRAFDTPWLSWLGPWQFDTFVGVLDDPRQDSNTMLAGARGSFMPLPHLEVGITRLSMLCGKNHPCNPFTGELHFQNSDSNPSPVHDQGTIDLRYTATAGAMQLSPYAQIMNRDNGPFVHAAASYLVGVSFAGPLGTEGTQWRMTAEYADTVATQNWFDFGKKLYGVAYNDYKYVDGNHYRGRTLGFSLDTDSRLFSLTDSFVDSHGRSYQLVYYRAEINVAPPGTVGEGLPAGTPSNFVSAKTTAIDQLEFGISIPWRPFTLNASVRDQDAQVYPDSGGKVSGEITLGYRF